MVFLKVTYQFEPHAVIGWNALPNEVAVLIDLNKIQISDKPHS